MQMLPVVDFWGISVLNFVMHLKSPFDNSYILYPFENTYILTFDIFTKVVAWSLRVIWACLRRWPRSCTAVEKSLFVYAAGDDPCT